MELLVQVPPSSAAVPPQIAYAFALAGAARGHLTALLYEIDVLSAEEEDETPPDEGLSAGQIAMRDRLEALARESGVDLEVVTGRNYSFTIGETLADYARLSDLVVLGVDGPLAFPYRHLAENVLFEAGRPLLLAPPHSRFALDRVVVAWDASRASTRALHGAMPLLVMAGEVVVASVTDDKEFRTGHSGVELCRRLSRRGVNARFHGVERGARNVGDAIGDLCADVQADLLVMGARRHSRLRDIIYGSATHALIDQGPRLPTLLAN